MHRVTKNGAVIAIEDNRCGLVEPAVGAEELVLALEYAESFDRWAISLLAGYCVGQERRLS